MNPSILTRHQEIEAITLTEEEIRRAIWSAKIQKWNEERNADYWRTLEGLKPKDDGPVQILKEKATSPKGKRKDVLKQSGI